MKTINVGVREEVEAFYPREDFLHDAALNSRPKTTVLHGIRILSVPNEGGEVRMSRGKQHVGEAAPDGDALFVCPYRTDGTILEDGAGYDVGAQEARSPASPDASYRDFIDRVVEAARSAHFPEAIGLHEGRLRGFHGG